jgi:hypothetical protein
MEIPACWDTHDITLDGAVNEVSEALSMCMVPPAIQIIMVPVGVTVRLGLHNKPCG